MRKSIDQIVSNFIGNSHDEDLLTGNFADEANYITWLIGHELGDEYDNEDLQNLYEEKYLKGYLLNEYKEERK